MGRSYWFECPKCGYRVKVSGRPDRGLNLFVQTIHCRDCRELHDVVTRVRIPDETQDALRADFYTGGLPRPNLASRAWAAKGPPGFLAALGRLSYTGVTRFKWLDFKLECPVSPRH